MADELLVSKLSSKHKAEIEYAVGSLEELRRNKRELELELQNLTAERTLLPPHESGWHRWLVWPVLFIGAVMEWNIAWLVAKTAFGLSEYALYAFAVALAICGVTAGWFIGRILRLQRSAGAEKSASLRAFILTSMIVVALLLAAAFVLRIQAARLAGGDMETLAIVGQALITTVLSALGILIAAGVEYFRQGDADIDAYKQVKAYEKKRDELNGHITRAVAHYLKSVRGYKMTMASVGGLVDDAYLKDMASRSGVPTSSGSGKSSDKPGESQGQPGAHPLRRFSDQNGDASKVQNIRDEVAADSTQRKTG